MPDEAIGALPVIYDSWIMWEEPCDDVDFKVTVAQGIGGHTGYSIPDKEMGVWQG